MRLIQILILNTLILFLSSFVHADQINWASLINAKNIVPYPIIFIHGISGGFQNWQPTVSKISSGHYTNIRFITDDQMDCEFKGTYPKNIKIWNMTYYTQNPINESLSGDLTLYATRLKNMIEFIKTITNQDKVILVAHSMGGLVARAYTVLDEESWQSVHKILTLGTPNHGVGTSVPIAGQWRDLNNQSDFIKKLNQDWLAKIRTQPKKWGVIGAIDINPNNITRTKYSPHMTDSGGLGYIAISSAIPFAEWKDAVGKNLNHVKFNTLHFAYRVCVIGKHDDLLAHRATFNAISWMLKKE